ncbi:ABC transporter ATP-binding protein [uncultured Nevskia sp.]|uniref:ABC transporter ATP-binding protein n=1 Tax=uncultured Nevskia sp. TaxID=228950 RepID=UPI0025D3ACAC|nr:ABC transporter ATP-binding protein [uncultured Nevskia sp.]
MNSETALEVRELVKHFKQVKAVNGLSFDVKTGTCFGLLGPNGAGKSTTIEMCEGLLTPTSGSIRYRGEPLGPRYRERVGIQFQSTALQDHLTVIENLRFFSALYPVRRSLDELIALCRLEDFLDRDSRKLSGGQRQRLLLAIALVNDPELLFLDEPTTGLDPQARRNFWDLVRDIKAAGRTIVLTTHYMEEAYLLCDEIVIVDAGQIIARGVPSQLLAEHFNDSVLEVPAAEAPKLAGSMLAGTPKGDTLEIQTPDVNAAVAALLAAGVSLAQLRIRPRTLEDLFIELTGRGLRE